MADWMKMEIVNMRSTHSHRTMYMCLSFKWNRCWHKYYDINQDIVYRHICLLLVQRHETPSLSSRHQQQERQQCSVVEKQWLHVAIHAEMTLSSHFHMDLLEQTIWKRHDCVKMQNNAKHQRKAGNFSTFHLSHLAFDSVDSEHLLSLVLSLCRHLRKASVLLHLAAIPF